MRGAPWDGLFYGFVIEAVVGLGALMLALQTPDFLTRAACWAVVVVLGVVAARTVHRALRLRDHPDRPVGRWWFGG